MEFRNTQKGGTRQTLVVNPWNSKHDDALGFRQSLQDSQEPTVAGQGRMVFKSSVSHFVSLARNGRNDDSTSSAACRNSGWSLSRFFASSSARCTFHFNRYECREHTASVYRQYVPELNRLAHSYCFPSLTENFASTPIRMPFVPGSGIRTETAARFCVSNRASKFSSVDDIAVGRNLG
jgi:hypothetical protein